MELRQLEYFQTVSRLRSITKAAERLHIAQPSITVAIQKLEEELGVQLLDRTLKQIRLTAEGKAFLLHVDDILSRIQDTMIEMQDYRLLQKGSIKMGITPVTGAFLFPQVFAKFQNIYPNFQLTVVEEGSLAIRTRLRRGELDLGFIIISDVAEDLETLEIFSGQFLVCLAQRHPLAALPTISFSKLRDNPFILFKEDTYTRQIILQECSKHHFDPHIVFSSSQIETILGLVEQGVGISFLPDVIVKKRTDIASRTLSEPIQMQTGIAWNKRRYLSKASKAFIDFVSTKICTDQAKKDNEIL